MYSTENELRKHICQRRITTVFAILEKNRLENVYMKQRFQEAILFQEYVSLTKTFDSWRLFVRDIQSSKLALKRILYLWREFAREERGKRLAFQILHKVLTLQQKRLMVRILSVLKQNVVNLRKLSKTLLDWRRFLDSQGRRMNAFIEKRNLLTQSIALTSWQFEVLIQQKLKEKEKQLLHRILLSWKQSIQDDIVKRCGVMRKVEEMVIEKDFILLGLSFYYLRVYSIMRRERKEIVSIAKRIRIKSTFLCWRRVTKQHVEERQMILMTIIFNRWQYYSEERKEKRKAALKAFMHWKLRNLNKFLRGWRNYANDKGNRMKIALSVGKHFKSSRNELSSFRSRDLQRRMTRFPLQSNMREFWQPRPLKCDDTSTVHRIEANRHPHDFENVVESSIESKSHPKKHFTQFNTLDTPLMSLHNQCDWLDTTSRHLPSSSNKNQDPIIPSWVREALSKHKSKRLDFQLRDEGKQDSSLVETRDCK